MRGFILEEEYQEVISYLKGLIVETVSGLDREITSDPSLLKAKVRSTLKKHFRNTMDRRPMIMPLIFEV
jgi:ribonuclease J